MIRLYVTKAEDIYARLEGILIDLTGEKQAILRTENGKPFVEGNPVYFSLSHSGTRGVIAVSDRPVGVDLELFKNKRHSAVISRFSDEEISEIGTEREFLIHWTAREAFIKMRGGTLLNDLKNITYSGGNLFFNGEKQTCLIQSYFLDYGVVTVCTE